MTFPVHAAVGVGVGILAYKYVPAFQDERVVLIVLLALLFSVWPDINVAWKKMNQHHHDITHYPIFPVGILAVAVYSSILGTENLEFVIFFAILWLLHLCLDSFGVREGMLWLWPLSKKEYSVTKLSNRVKLERRKITAHYFKHGVFVAEVLVVAAAAGAILSSF